MRDKRYKVKKWLISLSFIIYQLSFSMTLASCADFFDQPGDGEAIEEGRFFSDESAYR